MGFSVVGLVLASIQAGVKQDPAQGAQIDWPSWITAAATALGALGVGVAAKQFRQQRLADKVVETGGLLKEWYAERLWDLRTLLDATADIEENRKRANKLYHHIIGRRRGKTRLADTASDYIEELARLTERIEIYIRRRVADEAIIGDHIAYDVISTYYSVRDILAARAITEDLNYEGFRDLTLRLQDYSKLHPDDADLADELTYAEFPPLQYRSESASLGYRKSRLKQFRLNLADRRYKRGLATEK